MTLKLFFEALGKFALGIVLIGALLFIPAGTLHFFGAWLFMGVLFVPMLVCGIVMSVKAPRLLKERLDVKEKEKGQDLVVKLSGLMFLAGFVLSGLGHRFGWYELPQEASLVASALFFVAYILYFEVLRENAYLSRTVKVAKNQKLIDTGLYGIVRHPMYFATLFLFLAIPLVLGSLYAFAVFLAYPFIIVKRIKGEEELLEKELDGYAEYKKRVKYRLIPFVW